MGRDAWSAVAEKRFWGEFAPERHQALPIDIISRGLTRSGRLALMPVVVAKGQVCRRMEERLLLPA